MSFKTSPAFQFSSLACITKHPPCPCAAMGKGLGWGVHLFFFFFHIFKCAWKRHLWDIKNKIVANFSKISSKRAGITIGNTPHNSLGCGLCWLMDWQWEEQGEKWEIDIYKSDTDKLRFPWVAWECLVSSRTTWTHIHPKIGISAFQENGERGKNHKNPSVHILCGDLQLWGLRARGQWALNSLWEGISSWHNS